MNQRDTTDTRIIKIYISSLSSYPKEYATIQSNTVVSVNNTVDEFSSNASKEDRALLHDVRLLSVVVVLSEVPSI